MSAPDAVQLWLAKAQSDLLNIANNLAAHRVPWDTVCFHAQQAAEKTLKAFLVSHGSRPPRTHDCVALLEWCAQYDPSLAEHRATCVDLGQFAVAPRYPFPGEGPTREEGTSLARQARDLVRTIARRLNVSFDDPLEDML